MTSNFVFKTVNDHTISLNEVLGQGAFAKVCRAWPVEAKKNGSFRDEDTLACKVIEKD